MVDVKLIRTLFGLIYNHKLTLSFINAYRKAGKRRADVVLIDGGHLLLTTPDPYNKFRGHNQLADILQLARVVVLVFDFHQLVS